MEHYPHTDLIFFILKGKAKMIVNSQSRTTRKYELSRHLHAFTVEVVII